MATEEMDKYFEYLDRLRTSGVTNMFAGGTYLEGEFGLSHREAGKVLQQWMETFGARHPRGRQVLEVRK